MLICPSCGEHNPERFRLCGSCGTALRPEGPSPVTRKTVTILFSDLVGSTAMGERLDPEAVREIMAGYFDRMKACVEANGGVVEKYIGDAVMAVFGLPRAHEDDALRAVRAAADMRGALAALNASLQRSHGIRLANRTGVTTGEVVAGDAFTGQRLATGDVVNTAARLEQAASPGQILIGGPTIELVRHAVSATAVEAVPAKGKAEPVPAWSLDEVEAEPRPAQPTVTQLVGRGREMDLLLDAFGHVRSERATRLITVVGDPGVGKSRLVDELCRQMAGEATVLRGRCLSYGTGITFWPLAEMLKRAAGISDADSAEQATEKLRTVLAGSEDDLPARRLASALGWSPEAHPVEETFWAARKGLEHLAGARPVVAVFDDVHWAELTLLDLVVHLAHSGSSPLLLICVARPDLFDDHPDWPGGVEGAVRVDLEPLSRNESEELAARTLGVSALPVGVGGLVAGWAHGNPLFVEQLLAMWIDDGSLVESPDGWRMASGPEALSIPPTISAVLSARLDRLPGTEATVVQTASVMGQVFYRDAVEALSSESLRPHVAGSLRSLERRRIVAPESGESARDDALRFVHVLVRDAAYAATLKRTRADLHERFADWLVRETGERLSEYEELLAHHLEQAHRYLVELGRDVDRRRLLRDRAVGALRSAARRAADRGDARSAGRLLERALKLTPAGEPKRLSVLLELGQSLLDGGELQAAEGVVHIAVQEAETAGDDVALANAKVVHHQLRRLAGVAGWIEEAVRDAEWAETVCGTAGDHRGLARARYLLALASAERPGGWDLASARLREAAAEARLADPPDRSLEMWCLTLDTGTAVQTAFHAEAGIELCESVLARAEDSMLAQANTSANMAALLAMRADSTRHGPGSLERSSCSRTSA